LLLFALFVLTCAGCHSWIPWATKTAYHHRSTATEAGTPSRAPITQEDQINFLLDMASTFERQGSLDQAIPAYEAVLEHSDHVVALHRLAVLYIRNGNPTQALSKFEAALSQTRDDPEILCDLGYCQYLLRDFEAAEAALNESIRLAPKLRRAHMNLGMVFARTGRADMALRAFSAAGCTEAHARNNLAYALTTEAQWQLALNEYQRALQLNPSLGQARAGIEVASRMLARQQQ
jgi:tetratricopeptide (TPR) repeat protein